MRALQVGFACSRIPWHHTKAYDLFFSHFARGRRYPGSKAALMTSLSLSPSNYLEVAADEEFSQDHLLPDIANAMGRALFVPDTLTRWRVYHETRDAWTGILGVSPRVKVHFAEWLYPPNLAQTYTKAALSDRRHSALFSRIIRDLNAFGGDAAAASLLLAKSADLITTRADILELRARFYASRTRKARMKLMVEGTTGQYRHWNQGGVGVRNAPRDMLACLLCSFANFACVVLLPCFDCM